MKKFENLKSLETESISLSYETPKADEYLRLRAAAGLDARSTKGAAIGLPNTFFAATLRRGGQLIGMGRIVGDGGLVFQIVDIAIDPAWQARGLGKIIVSELVEHVRANVPDLAHVSLLADGPAKYLYAKFGFEETAPASIGMAFINRRDAS